MNNYSSYYFFQKYETRSGSTTIPVLPITYSLDADGTMPLVVRQADDPECGATPVQYRWVNMAVSTNYICDGYDKYYKQMKQQSTDGQTWTDVVPAEYRRGDLYQPNSPDCGFVTDYIFTGTCPTGSEVFTVAMNVNAQVQTEKIADGEWGVRYNNSLISLKSAFVRKSTITSAVATSIINTSSVDDLETMFSSCSGLTSVNLSNLNTSNVTDMRSMFSYCTSLTSLNLSGWNTSNVTSMESVFADCTSLTSINLSGWNTTKATNMSWMFASCSGLTSLDVSSFNTSNVTDMYVMFSRCSGLTSLDLSNFDTSKVTNMCGMFMECTNLQSINLSSFDFSNVTCYNYMFSSCPNLRTIYCSSSNKAFIQARVQDAGLTQSINYIII